MNLAKWLYRDGRPNRLAMVLNRWSGAIHAFGVAPNYLVTLDVPGRRSGRICPFTKMRRFPSSSRCPRSSPCSGSYREAPNMAFHWTRTKTRVGDGWR
jgi:hypothetical protein